MLRSVINHVPVSALVAGTIVVTVCLVLLGVWLIRRLVPVTREGFDAEVSSQMLGVVASLFGLLLAFVIVIEYQNFGNAQENVGQEADSLSRRSRATAKRFLRPRAPGYAARSGRYRPRSRDRRVAEATRGPRKPAGFRTT